MISNMSIVNESISRVNWFRQFLWNIPIEWNDSIRNEYTDWDRPSALDALSMRDSLSSALSDALVVAPLMHVVHLHAQRSANPSGTFFYHFQGQIAITSSSSTGSTTTGLGYDQLHDADQSEYHVRDIFLLFFFHFNQMDDAVLDGRHLWPMDDDGQLEK